MRVSPADGAGAHCAIAGQLEAAGLYEAAARSYRTALGIAPESTKALTGLGTCLRFAGDFEEARTALERALSLEPDKVDAHFVLGNVFRAWGRLELAQAAYRRVLQRQPDHAEARYFLSVVTPGDTPRAIPSSLVKDLFDRYAPNFDDHVLGVLEYRGHRLLREAVAAVMPTTARVGSVIDLGCGTGLCGPPFRDLAAHLTGVDLAPAMIARARERGVYDELRVDDLFNALRTVNRRFDLAVAADVLGYIGDLGALFSAGAGALREGGRFAFTAECTEDAASFVLLPEGRFAHGKRYIETAAATAGFAVERYGWDVLRTEHGRPISGHVYVLRLVRLT